jgi:hypothetical protein
MTKPGLILASDHRLFRTTCRSDLQAIFFTVAAAVNLTSELTSSSMRNGRGPDLIIVDSPLDLDHGITGPQK